MKQVHVVVSGQVQGVGFRAWTKRTARSMGLTGWVQNTPEGTVEIVASGDEEVLRAFLVRCAQGPDISRVDDVRVVWGDGREAWEDFRIVR